MMFVEGGEVSDVLHEAFKPILDVSQCETALFGLFNRTTMMCAGKYDGGAGPCLVRTDTQGPQDQCINALKN